jgi:hypothetical protein
VNSLAHGRPGGAASCLLRRASPEHANTVGFRGHSRKYKAARKRPSRFLFAPAARMPSSSGVWRFWRGSAQPILGVLHHSAARLSECRQTRPRCSERDEFANRVWKMCRSGAHIRFPPSNYLVFHRQAIRARATAPFRRLLLRADTDHNRVTTTHRTDWMPVSGLQVRFAARYATICAAGPRTECACHQRERMRAILYIPLRLEAFQFGPFCVNCGSICSLLRNARKPVFGASRGSVRLGPDRPIRTPVCGRSF